LKVEKKCYVVLLALPAAAPPLVTCPLALVLVCVQGQVKQPLTYWAIHGHIMLNGGQLFMNLLLK